MLCLHIFAKIKNINKTKNNKLLCRGVTMVEYAVLLAFISIVSAVFIDNNDSFLDKGIQNSINKVIAIFEREEKTTVTKPLITVVKLVKAKDLEALKNFNASFYRDNAFSGVEGVFRNGETSEGMDQELINKLNELGGAWLYSSAGKEIVYTTADISNLPKGTMVPAIYAQNGTDRYIVGYAYVNGNGQLATLGDLDVNSYKLGTSGSYYSNATNLPAAYNNTSGTMSFIQASKEYERIVKEYNDNNLTSYNRDKDKLNMYDPFNVNNSINI